MSIRNRLALFCSVLPLASGCASYQALQAEVVEKDSIVRDLRHENTDLKRRLENTLYEKDQVQAALDDVADLLDERPTTILPASSPTQTLAPSLNREGLDEVGVSVSRRGSEVVFTIPSKVTFASGSASLSREGEQVLLAVARRLKSDFGDQAIFHIEGHTDSDRIKVAKFPSNRDLSWARARAVHDQLVTRGEIGDERFVVVGHGPHRPLASNNSKEGKAQNRRVEVVVR